MKINPDYNISVRCTSMAEPQNISRKYQNRMINAQYPKHQLNKHKKTKKRRINVRQPNQEPTPKTCLTQEPTI